METKKYPKWGEVWLVDLGKGEGHTQGNIRPVLITTNNIGNSRSAICGGWSFTSQRNDSTQITHAKYLSGEGGLYKPSVYLGEQSCNINQYQLVSKLGDMNKEQITRAAIATVYANPFLMLAFEAGVHKSNQFQKVFYS